jgi:hypothetical protein
MTDYEQLALISDSEAKTGRVGLEVELAGIEDLGSRELYREIKLAEALQRYEVVSMNSNYMVVTDKKLADPSISSDFALMELGYSSPSPWTAWTRDEHVPELRDRQGLTKYYRMPRNDGIVRAALRLLKTPIQSARWFVEPYDDSKKAKTIADFVQDNLTNKMNVSWQAVLNDILLMAHYGYMPFEKVYKLDPDGKLRLRKLAPRHPLDVREWRYDVAGGPAGIVMETNGEDDPYDRGVFIPIEKLVVFTLDSEAGDMKGLSVLRSAYKHWFYKDTLYKIDAIQKERHGIGIPLIKLPMNFTNSDRLLAEELGRNLRTNERAHVVLLPGWDLMFAKVEGQMVDCMKSIEHHDMAIASNILGPFLKTPQAKEDSMTMFMKSTRYIADLICAVVNHHLIPQLVDFNFVIGASSGYPRLRSRRIGEWDDVRTLTFALRNLVGANLVTPDETLEAHLRREIDMPAADLETRRDQPAPQQPGDTTARAGMPRQQPVGAFGTPRSNAGTDRDGGK